MMKNIPMLKSLFIGVMLASVHFLSAQSDSTAFFEALEQYPDAHEIWVQNGNRNSFDVDFVIVEPTCNGDSDGSICAEPVIPGSYTYFWFGSNSPLQCTTNVDAGSYLIQVTNTVTAESCIYNVDVNEPSPIGVFGMNAVPPTCAEQCTGQANPLAGGGTGALNYAYDSGENTQAATMLCNPFTLTVTDDNGCSVDTTFQFLNAPDTLKISALVMDVSCGGVMDGSIDATIEGGTGTIDYSWEFMSAEIATVEDISMLGPGDYTLTVTDDNGCTEDSLFTILDAIPIEVTGLVTNVICNDDTTGAIAIDVIGGDGNFIFSWTGPDSFTSALEDIDDLAAGTYNLTITDGLSCDKDTFFIVQESLPILITAVITEVDCFDALTGAIDATVSGPFPIVSYDWSGDIVAITEDISGLSSGTYTLEVTDNQGCMVDSTFVLDNPDEIVLSAVVTDLLCAGAGTGAIDLTATGGTGTLVFDWSPGGAVTEDLNGIPADDYTVIVTDDNLCSASIMATVDEPLPITVDETITNVSCNAGANGNIDIIVSGGTGAYTISWMPVLPNNVPAGLYTLTVQDENLCQEIFVYEITEPSPIVVDITVVDATCNGLNDGSIAFTPSGGTGTLTEIWTPAIDPSMVAAGDYLLTLTDDNMCQLDTLITVDEPDAIFIDIDITHLACFGDTDGVIDITPMGGTGTFTFAWTGPAGPYDPADEDIAGLVAGIYTVVVTDQNNCTETISGEVLEPLSIVVDALITDVDCNGESTGSIDVSVSNGSGVYDYLWSGPSITAGNETDEDVFNLAAGVYNLTVTDDNLCSIDTLFEVIENTPIVVVETITDVLCFGDSTGAVELDVTGGSGVLTYFWTNGLGITGFNQDLLGVPAGTYTLTVTDGLLCEFTQDYVVDQAAAILIDALVIDPLCFGEANGSIDVTATGDFPDFVHAWTGPPGYTPVAGVGLDIMDLEEGSYTVIVIDDEGCSVDSTFLLVDPTDLDATLSLTDPGCDLTNGMAEATVSGGTVAGSYTFSWFNADMTPLPSTGPIQGGLGAGAYIFIVTDDNGCSVTIPFELSDEVGSISALITDVPCFGDCIGAIDVEILDLTGVLDINWTGPDGPFTTEDIMDLCAGDYTITVEDELGCELVETYTVDSPGDIVLVATIINETCPDANDGAIDITGSGGTGVLSYLWNGPGVVNVPTQDLSGLEPGSYTVEVTDENNCTHTESYIVDPAQAYALTAVVSDVSCAGADDGSIDVTVSPALLGATYQWTAPGFTAATEDIMDLGPDTYVLEITTVDFCVIDTFFTVTEPDAIVVVPLITNSACGMSIGAVDFTITGGTVAGNYGIDVYTIPGLVPVGTTNLDGGTYGYTVTDDNGCEAMGTFAVSDEFGTLSAAITGVSCVGAMNGAIDITVAGLTGLLDIQWTFNSLDFSTDEDISMLNPGSYTVSITDENGCVLGDTYVVPDAVGIGITALVDDVTCNGDGDGAIDISFTGVQGSPDFDWTFMSASFSSSEDISGLDGGVYTITITDDAGCTGTQDFTVDEPEVLDVDATIVPVLCNGESTGAILIDILGGTGPFDPTWTWAGGTSGFEDLNGIEAGTYTLDLLDFNGCSFSMDYEVTQASAISIDTLLLVNANCDQADGSIIVVASGGNSPYDYTWTNSSNVEISSLPIADNLVSGTYTVEIVDEDLCSVSFDITVSNTDATLTAAITEPTCFGFDDGAIDLTVTGDVTPVVTYSWTGPGGPYFTEDISGLEAGDYTVVVSDGAGCMYQETFTVPETADIVITEVITDVSCNDFMNGSINISHNLGTEPTYLWNGPGVVNVMTQDLSNLEGGTYDLTVTVAGVCVTMYSFDVVNPDTLEGSAVVTMISCNGGANGAIDLTLTGGTGDYDVVWEGPNNFVATSPDINGLETGIYMLSVFDDNFCQLNQTYEVTQADEITITVLDQGPSSCVVPTGFIEVEGVGGNDGFTYIWTNSMGDTVSQVALAEMLPADTYTVEVTDALGCTTFEDYIISNAGAQLIALISDVSCYGLDDGAIDITVMGSSVLVDTIWTGPSFTASTEDISGLIAGEYIVELVDEFGCTFSESYTVDQPDSIEVTVSLEDVDCFGDEDGSISITSIIGGVGDYSTEWVDEDGAPVPGGLEITDLENGTYTLTVTDEVPCIVAYDFVIDAPDEITVDENLLDPTCVGLEDGAITINVNGGQGGYEFEWTGGISSMDEDLINLGPGTYDLLITDDSLCTHTESYVLTGLQAIVLDLVIDSITCFGANDGAISATASAGNGGFIFEWTVGGSFLSDQSNITDLSPETYDLEIVDAIGCALDTSVTLFEPDEIAALLDALESLNCNGDANGSIDLTTSGGTGAFDFSWVGPGFTAITEDISGLSGGTYTLTITDQNDCQADFPFEVIEPDALNIALISSQDSECQNTADGGIEIEVTGGITDYVYDWQGPDFLSNDEDITGLLPGIYTLLVTDDNGCTITEAYSIDYLVEVFADAGDYDPICTGNELTLTGQGLPANSLFSWNTPGSAPFSFDPITDIFPLSSNNVFIFTVSNGNCVATDTAFIDVQSLPQPDAGEDQEVFLDDQVLLGGVPWPSASTYIWSPPDGLDDPNSANPTWQLVTGSQLFTLTVIDLNGCIGVDEVLITINPTIEVPSGFTPNNDGPNDDWIIQNTAQFPEMTVQVYNRWGDQLWVSQPGYTKPWDGRYKDKDLPVGTYYFIIELNDERFPDPITGPITIFR